MEKQTIIEKHIAGTLSSEEQKQFESWMSTDRDFKDDFEFQQDLVVVTADKEKDVLKARLGKVESNIAGGGKNRIRRVLLLTVGLLLLVLAFLGYKMQKMKASPAGIYAANYEVYPNIYHPVTRGNSDALTRAFMKFENGDYAAAAELLSPEITRTRSNELKFYRALSYGEIGNLPLAIQDLEDIRRFSHDYLDETYWYLGLYYLKQDRKQEATERFQDFYELSDDPTKKQTAKKIIFHLLGK